MSIQKINQFFILKYSESEESILPGTVREEFPPKKTIRPQVIPNNIPKNSNGHANNSPSPVPPHGQQQVPVRVRPLTPATYDRVPISAAAPILTTTTTRNPISVIAAAHPQDNEIAGSVNIR